MRELGACKLTDVLAEWGSHNTEWRIGRVVTDPADAVEVTLKPTGGLLSAASGHWVGAARGPSRSARGCEMGRM